MTEPRRPAVTFVHGWTDSGADALARRLAASAGGEVVVVVPGGAPQPTFAGVETVTTHESIGFRTRGCACCAQRIDLVDTLGRIARRRRPPAHIVVLELPGTDPATPVVTLLDDPDLARLVRLDAVLLAIDGPATTTAATGTPSPWPSDRLADAAMLADAVWISRGALLTPHGIQRATDAIQGLNPLAWVDASTTPRLADALSHSSWSPASTPSRLARLHTPFGAPGTHPAGGRNRTGSMTFAVDGLLDPDRLEEWLHALHGAAGARLLRIEAVLALADRDGPLHLSGCRTAVRHDPGPPWVHGAPHHSRLRIAGRDLALDDLGASLLACRV